MIPGHRAELTARSDSVATASTRIGVIAETMCRHLTGRGHFLLSLGTEGVPNSNSCSPLPREQFEGRIMKNRTGKECKKINCVNYHKYSHWTQFMGDSSHQECMECKNSHVSQYRSNRPLGVIIKGKL